jgi:hypothetical protein
MQSLHSIKFIDATGQRYEFERDADDGIFSLVLVPLKRGLHSLVVNGDNEVYHMRPKDIIAVELGRKANG